MPTVINTSMFSLSGIRYDVYLDNGAPSADGLSLAIRSASLSYKDDTTNVSNTLLTSKMEVTFSVRTPAERAVFTDMVEANELQYRLRIERDGQLWWVGFVLVDLVSETFGGFPKDFTVAATDGISRLKTIDYDPGDLETFDTVKNHLYRIFGQISLSDYYATGAEMLRAHLSQWPNGITPSDAKDLLASLRISFKALRTVNDQGEVSYRTYYQALKEILRLLNARLLYSEGRYVITDMSSYSAQTVPVTFQRYDKDAARLSPVTTSNWVPYQTQVGPTLATSDAVARARGKVTYLAPLRAVDLTYKHFSRQNILPRSSSIIDGNDVLTLDNFGTDDGAGYLVLSGTINVNIDRDDLAGVTGNFASLYSRVKVTVSITDENDDGVTLNRTATISAGGVTYDEPIWVENPDDDDVQFALRHIAILDGNSPTATPNVLPASLPFQVTTPAVPQGGRLKVLFAFDSILVGGSSVSPVGSTFQVTGLFVESILAGSIEDQYNYTKFEPTTAATGQSSVVIEETMLFGDGPGDNTFGRVEYLFGTDEWRRVDGWVKWMGGTLVEGTVLPIGSRRAQSILGLQATQREQLNVTFIAAGMPAESIVVVASSRYVLQSGDYSLYDDEWRGRWFEIGPALPLIEDPGTPNNGTVGGPDIDDDFPDPPSPPAPGGFGGNPTGGLLIGDVSVGTNTVPTETDAPIVIGENIGGLTVPNSEDSPFFAGDTVILTDPISGQTQEFVVSHDSGYVPGNQTDPGAVPSFGENGIEWLVPTTTEIAIVPTTATVDFPSGSYVQPSAQNVAQERELLRTDHIDANLFGWDTALTVGFLPWFWRTGRRIGWRIRRVHFALGQNGTGATVKINLKYYDATGFRYTVATYQGAGLGGIEIANADVLPGYLRVEVESITGTAPTGLAVYIELLKRIA